MPEEMQNTPDPGLKERTALTTLSLNGILTLTKFALWGLSGSLAVLAR